MRKRKKMALFQILQRGWWHCILIKFHWVYEHENVVGGICIMWNENAFDDNMVWINMLKSLMRESYTIIYCRDYFMIPTIIQYVQCNLVGAIPPSCTLWATLALHHFGISLVW
jgi:hypothetical protein